MSGRVRIVGLGPGGPDLVTAGTAAAIAEADTVIARTARHPAVSVLSDPVFCDDVYESAANLDEVYRAIVERVVVAAEAHDLVVYAVPGSPVVAERTVQLLLADDRIDVDVLPALSFLDLAWARLGIDPVDAGVALVDGHEFAVAAAGKSGPFLVGQCDSPLVLSDIKLSVEDWPETPITVVHHLGLPDERIFEVSWADLDREVEADHLTSLYIPTLGAPVAAELVRFDELVHALRTGCPWDREQTHASLQRYLLEECYELLEAIDGFDGETGEGADDLCEELGDVLFQVFLHATIAAESGWFTLADVASGVHDKLRDRHPHVFGTAEFDSIDELVVSWEAAKVAEKSRSSVMDGIPRELPALLAAYKVRRKAEAAGFAEPVAAPVEALVETLSPFDAGQLGAVLLDLAELARHRGVDPEDALRRAVNGYRARFEAASERSKTPE